MTLSILRALCGLVSCQQDNIYSKEQRAIRDLLRRRLSLVRTASAQLISVQSQIWRSTGIRLSSGELRKLEFAPPLVVPAYCPKAIRPNKLRELRVKSRSSIVAVEKKPGRGGPGFL